MVKWCGRIIDGNGYQLHPRDREAIRDMNTQTNVTKLCQFIHCCRWMSSCTTSFHRREQRLNDILEKAYFLVGKRNKSSMKNIPRSELSGGTEQTIRGHGSRRCACLKKRQFAASDKAGVSNKESRNMYSHWRFRKILCRNRNANKERRVNQKHIPTTT